MDSGPPPLSIAVRSGHLGSVEMLLSLGADVDGLSRRGQSALLTAILSNQSTEIVDTLLAHGADTTLETSCETGCGVEGSHDALGWAGILDRQALIPALKAASRILITDPVRSGTKLDVEAGRIDTIRAGNLPPPMRTYVRCRE